MLENSENTAAENDALRAQINSAEVKTKNRISDLIKCSNDAKGMHIKPRTQNNTVYVSEKQPMKETCNWRRAGRTGGGGRAKKSRKKISQSPAAILKHRKRGRKYQYLIRWEGYDSDEDEWRAESDLQNCADILESYKSAHML